MATKVQPCELYDNAESIYATCFDDRLSTAEGVVALAIRDR